MDQTVNQRNKQTIDFDKQIKTITSDLPNKTSHLKRYEEKKYLPKTEIIISVLPVVILVLIGSYSKKY